MKFHSVSDPSILCSGGSYSIYYALAVASKQLNLDHRYDLGSNDNLMAPYILISLYHRRPDFTNTEPAAKLGPFPQWADEKKIVAMDPWGHLSPWLFKDTIEGENGQFSFFFSLLHMLRFTRNPELKT